MAKRLPKRGQQIAVRWKLKEEANGTEQYFLAKVRKVDRIQKSFEVEYIGYTVESGDRYGTIHLDDTSLPWHVVEDCKKSTSIERIKDVQPADHLILHHLDRNNPPILYECIVEKVDHDTKNLKLFFIHFGEYEVYSFKSMKKEVWHKIS